MSGSFPAVLKEIVDRLRADDWERCSTEDDSDFYYVLGVRVRDAEVRGEVPINSYWMGGVGKKTPAPLPALGGWYLRAQTGARQQPYLERAAKRLERKGVARVLIDAMIEGPTAAEKVRESEGQNAFDALIEVIARDREACDAFSDFSDALRIARSNDGSVDLDSDDRAVVEDTQQKYYLQEICRKYERIVKRVAALDVLAFEDPLIHEASKCYLYGFCRSAILVAASSVEARLKEATGETWIESYAKLVDAAWDRGKLGQDGALRHAAKEVFRIRREVAHDAREPSEEETQKALDLARSVVAHLAAGRG